MIKNIIKFSMRLFCKPFDSMRENSSFSDFLKNSTYMRGAYTIISIYAILCLVNLQFGSIRFLMDSIILGLGYISFLTFFLFALMAMGKDSLIHSLFPKIMEKDFVPVKEKAKEISAPEPIKHNIDTDIAIFGISEKDKVE